MFVLCMILQFVHAQTVQFVFNVTNASSDTTSDGQITVQCINPTSPLTYKCYIASGSQEPQTVISTDSSISGLYPGHYYFELSNSYCELYLFDFYVTTSSQNTTYQLDLTLNLSNSSAPASLTVNNFTGGLPPYHIGFYHSDTTFNTFDTVYNISNISYNNLLPDFSNYVFYINDSNTFIDNCDFGCNQIGFLFTTTYDKTGSSCATNIEKIIDNELMSIYPNPSNGIFTVTSSKKMTTYSIFDALGRKVASKTTDSITQSIDIQSLNTGMYYLMVQFEDGTIGKQKLMKK
jgi:hypothetical protein